MLMLFLFSARFAQVNFNCVLLPHFRALQARTGTTPLEHSTRHCCFFFFTLSSYPFTRRRFPGLLKIYSNVHICRYYEYRNNSKATHYVRRIRRRRVADNLSRSLSLYNSKSFFFHSLTSGDTLLNTANLCRSPALRSIIVRLFATQLRHYGSIQPFNRIKYLSETGNYTVSTIWRVVVEIFMNTCGSHSHS